MLSIMLAVILVGYTAQKIDILYGRKGDELQSTELKGAVSYNETLTATDGLSIAFGIQSTNGVQVDESYGYFKVFTR